MLRSPRDLAYLMDSIPNILLWVWGSLLVGVLATLGSAYFVSHTAGIEMRFLPKLMGMERVNTRVRGGTRIRRPSASRPELIEHGRALLRAAAKND